MVAAETNENRHLDLDFTKREPPKSFVTAESSAPRKKPLAERNDTVAPPSGREERSGRAAGSSPGSKPYDPMTNYLSPRPRFLRYDPDRRKEIFLRREQELGSSFCSEDGSGSGSSASFSQEHVNGLEEKGFEGEGGLVDGNEEEKEEDAELMTGDVGGLSSWSLVWKFMLLLLGVVLLSSCYIATKGSSPSRSLHEMGVSKQIALQLRDSLPEFGGELEIVPTNLEGSERDGVEMEIRMSIEDEPLKMVDSELMEAHAQMEIGVETDGLGPIRQVKQQFVIFDEMNYQTEAIPEMDPKFTSEENGNEAAHSITIPDVGHENVGSIDTISHGEEDVERMEDGLECQDKLEEHEQTRNDEFGTSNKIIPKMDPQYTTEDDGNEPADSITIPDVGHESDRRISTISHGEEDVERMEDELECQEWLEHDETGNDELGTSEEGIDKPEDNASFDKRMSQLKSLAHGYFNSTVNSAKEHGTWLVGIVVLLATTAFGVASFCYSKKKPVPLASTVRPENSSTESTEEKRKEESITISHVSHPLPADANIGHRELSGMQAPEVALLEEFSIADIDHVEKVDYKVQSKFNVSDEAQSSLYQSRAKSSEGKPASSSKKNVSSSKKNAYISSVEFSTPESRSFGSFNTQEVVVKKKAPQGGQDEKAVVTPVRRSSRIRHRIMSP